ncbi:AAA family ATPase [Bacillus thuringiensis]|uniref:AAA family ATPase n=1 Tax=Bacillus thuringiensis TaxID=1428 RepID=UPI001EDE71AD|nr:AAA family ATPase [Bacillus thuringiensis]MCG3426183.1 AAA family ATPase [Bacillus thuringiensis]
MFLKKVTILHENIKDYNYYPFSIPYIKNLEYIDFNSPVTFFVGENGSGKSTLLEAIADKCEFNTAGGNRNNMYDVYASGSDLGEYVRLSWLPKVTNGFFLRAESFYHFATHIDHIDGSGFKSYGGRSLLKQSHGESFLSLFSNRFNNDKAIYLLDEPEAALSPSKQLVFMKIINDLIKTQNIQFIIATHSPILLGFPNATIYNFDNKIEQINYEMTDHYNLTKYYMQNRENLLNNLFSNE